MTGQVRVRVMPAIDWIRATTSRPQRIHIFRSGPDDDVVRSGHVVGLGHSIDHADLFNDLLGLADFRLDEDVCLDHAAPLGLGG